MSTSWALVAALALGASTPSVAQVLDPGFAPSINDTVRAVAVQADGHLVIGGDFTQVGGQSRPHLARLSANGIASEATAIPDDRVLAIAVQADGTIVIGGDFGTIGGVTRRYVARLLANGQIDSSFQSDVGYTAGLRVTALAVQADGKVVIAGGFDTVSGQPRSRLARLNANGSNDNGFTPPPLNGVIDALLLQPDGRVVLAGPFDDTTDDCGSYCVLRLDPTGALDTSFGVVPVTGRVNHLARQADGRILVGGEFGALDDHATYFIGRLGNAGGVDTGFANTALRYSNITRVVPLPDGRILIAGEMRWGTTGATRDRIARLQPGGARDLDFDEPDLDSMIIGSALQPDLHVLVAGLFTQVAGQTRTHLVRIRAADLPDPIFNHGFE